MIIAKDLVQRLEALKREEYDKRDEAFNAAIDYAIDEIEQMEAAYEKD